MLGFFNIKTNTLGKTAFILAFFTLGSQVLAIIRDKIFAIKFGASIELDIYYAAFKIPHVIFLLTGTLISSFILMSFFERKKKEGGDSLQNFIDKVFFTFMVFMVIVSILCFVLLPQISSLFFPGFEGENADSFIMMSRMLLISPIFLGISSLFTGLNQMNGYFISTASTGVFYNFFIIFGIIVLYPFFGFNGIILGVLLGSLFYLLIQLPSIFKEKIFPKKIQFFSFKESLEILKVSIPRSFSLVLSELLLVLLMSKASTLPEGSIVILVFVLNISMVPIRLITTSYSIASFPKMAKYFVNNEIEELKSLIRNIISKVFFFGFPAAFFFLFFSDIIVGFLLGSQKFGWSEIYTTALLISLVSFVVVIQSMSIIIMRVFYAIEKTKIVFMINLITLFSFFLIHYALSKEYVYNILNYFIVEKYFTSGVLGLLILILSYLITFSLSSFLTIVLFKKYFVKFRLLKNTNWVFKMLISFSAVFFARFLYQIFIYPVNNSFFEFTYSLIFAVLLSIIFFIIFSELFKFEEYAYFKRKIINKFLKFNK